jgi:hypothetical protein
MKASTYDLHFVWNMQHVAERQRAPPLSAPTTSVQTPTVTRHRPASRLAMALASMWLGVLFGTLLGLGRVPWPEALAWSCISAIIVWRGLATTLRSTFDHLLASVTIELGMGDPQARRGVMVKALHRRGYNRASNSLHADRFTSTRFPGLLPPVKIAWSGPGAIVEGPRLLVRLIARIAVG